MQKILILLIIGLTLSGCSWVRRMDIEQGNVANASLVSQLHRGMTKKQVVNVMGTPILMNTFADDRVDYVYTFKPGNGYMKEQYVTLIFRRGVLQDIHGNMYSEFMDR